MPLYNRVFDNAPIRDKQLIERCGYRDEE